MTETRGGSPWLAIGLMLAAALAVVLCFAIWQIGSEFLRTLMLILTVAVALALVIVASAVAIRAWRRKDFTGDHFHTDGTRTIVKETRVLDGRQPAQTDIKVLQMPQAAQAGAFPELLRAAYQSGMRSLPAGSAAGPLNGYHEAELPEVDFDDSEGWSGDIRT